MRSAYEAVIGLEVHCQLQTRSKVFASDAALFGNQPNTNISVITLGHPGTLPKLNRIAVEYAIRMGLACNCEISRYNIFDRKNYFYPDLPKGYQLTQDKTPICRKGYVTVRLKDGSHRDVIMNRIHLEEDAGKSIHLAGEPDTLVDYNRAGTALIEIVTEPVIRTSEEAAAYLTEIRKLVRYLNICDGNMEEGSMRCDANISIMPKGSKVLGTKVEVKNMNSIRNVQRAIDHEIDRQLNETEKGNTILSETRTFDAGNGQTYSMRTKETMNDYRYFPEPDLAPLIVSEEWLESIRAAMPSLPQELHRRFVNEYGLPDYDAGVLTDSRETADYFEKVCRHTKNFKAASNWVMTAVKSVLNERNLDIKDFPVGAGELAGLINLVDSGKVNHTIASQKIFPLMIEQPGKTAAAIAEENNLLLQSDGGTLQTLINEVLLSNPEKVKEFRKGKKALLGMFMGEVMKRSGGKADPKLTTELLTKTLKEA
jgi:aspartyl-tRNA(Asn)/glutamyl-tRNA(Gln) amidotransferase subunit B